MCGIAGVVAKRRNFDLEQVVRQMMGRVRHRGPDDEGFYLDGPVALGHRRLSIIDLSPLGRQPMSFADGNYVITYNGEIYNYVELRSELQQLGIQFRTRTDTEVILAAYSVWGRECLERFNGMWSFAIHDRVENVVFAARDRFGVKPFYYAETDACFAFGSEIREVLPLLPSVTANPTVVVDFLLTGAQVQSTKTFFGGVSNLLPGHWLVYEVETNRVVIGRYYNLLEKINGRNVLSGSEGVDTFRSLLEDSVRLRLRSDVQVGTCLSGGLDSSSVALVAARMYGNSSDRRFSAVTAVSEDPRNSEEAYAEKVVSAGTLHWLRTRPTYGDFRALLPQVVSHQEEPFGSPSICMQAFVMRTARENGVVVLLDGQGGDESLLGYDRYYPAYCAALWREGGVRAVLGGMRDSTLRNANMKPWRFAAITMFGLVPSLRYLYCRRRAGYLAAPPPRPVWMGDFAAAYLDIHALQVLEMETTGLPELLRYEDKNSMAFSVETRLPYLDYRLVETALTLPLNLKMRDGWTKWVLRQALSDVLPPAIAWRRNKIGFEAPTDLWLSQHMDIMSAKVEFSPLVRRYCDLAHVKRRFPTLDRNSQWRLYSLALWEEAFGVAA